VHELLLGSGLGLLATKWVFYWHLRKDGRLLVMKSPANSPDLNPIEKLWTRFKIKFHEQRLMLDFERMARNFRAMARYTEMLKRTWKEVAEVAERLVESMPRRIEVVIGGNGGHTKY